MSIAKKIFIISSVLLSAVLFFLGIYNISFKKEIASVQTEIKTSQDNSTSGSKSALDKIGEAVGIINKEKIYSLSNEPVIGPIVTDDGEKIEYYSRTNGNVFKVFSGGEGKETISSSNLSGLENIFWSPDGSKVISRFNENGKIQYSTYDYKEKKGFKLSEGVEYAVWNNLGDRIFYEYFDTKTKKITLNISDIDGKNWKKIADVNFNNVFISVVPQSSFVYPKRF
jgi:opacity protein-like surface antigen